jgi:RNA polymerase sigma-70 factor (ECF subfamily)
VRKPERFEIFVLGVCNNVLRETYRQQRRLVQMQPEFDLPTDAPSPDERVITSETGSYVQRLLCNLDPNVRAILEAAFLEEQDRSEICLRFGISRDHLRLLIHRAKKMFGNCAQQEMTGKPRARCTRRSGRRVFASITPQLAMPSTTERCSAPIFMPLQATTEALAEQYCA